MDHSVQDSVPSEAVGAHGVLRGHGRRVHGRIGGMERDVRVRLGQVGHLEIGLRMRRGLLGQHVVRRLRRLSRLPPRPPVEAGRA